MASPTLHDRIQRLEDIEEIRQLKARYARYCDADYDAEALAPLFTEDAVWDGQALGRYEGRTAIHTFFANASAVMPFSIHHVMNPEIEVGVEGDPDRASGRWLLWQPCIHAEAEQALWMAGSYSDQYRREGGVWRFAAVRIQLRMLSPYEAGWSRKRMIEVPS